MEQIYVESSKSYNHGFTLKEQDLRRLVDLINDQFKKLSVDPAKYAFTIKYKNGAIANTPDIEEVLKQENEGSTSIVKLEINAEHTLNEKKSQIRLIFINNDNDDNDGDVPVRHLIKGQSRDWVFVTSSLIEERVVKIKRTRILSNIAKGNNNVFYRLSLPLIMLIVLTGVMSSLTSSLGNSVKQKNNRLMIIEEKWKSHQLNDPIEVMLQIEKARSAGDSDIENGSAFITIFFAKPVLYVFISFATILIGSYTYLKYYPVYNFYWGGYIEHFDKIESRRKLIIGIILGTIVLGVAVNLLSNVIWNKL